MAGAALAGEGVPAEIGPYRVVRSLGAGAFGLVFLCDQEEPIRRQVAVKVLRPGAGDHHTLARFAQERQLLAQLSHPAIAHVLDAGTLEDGRPFFVLEYVDGMPVRTYCDDKELPVDARLRLFLELCRGVGHAHRRGIVHRDLKPANVLVVESEGGPRPKIIDFGIAKALHAPPSARGVDTEAGRVVGTPGYMSPEQAAGNAAEVDARADVFALGVMLYELLTGELPFGRRTAGTDSEPARPSERVLSDRPSAGERARRRRCQPRQLALSLRGDLDCIALKALAEVREQRYASALELAADVERHLRGEPILARPAHAGRRALRWLRRRRAALAGALALLALALGAWSALHFSSKARARAGEADAAEERLEAQAQAADARAERALEQATLAAEKLVARANDERMRQPENEAVRQALAQDALGFYDQWMSERPTERRLRVGRCRALVSLSSVHWQLGQGADALRTAAEAAAEAEELFAEAPEELELRGLLAEALRRHGRALVLEQEIGAALPRFEAAVQHLDLCNRAAPKGYALSLSSAYRELGTTQMELGHGETALDAFRRSVQVLEEHAGAGEVDAQVHSDLAIARDTLVHYLVPAGGVEEAKAVAAAAVAGLAAVTLDVHRVTGRVHMTLSQLAQAEGDRPAALEHAALAVAAEERWYAAEPARFLPGDVLIDDLGQLAELTSKAGDWQASDRALHRGVEIADALVARFPGDASRLLRLEGVLHDAAFQLYDRLRLPDLEQAQVFIQRALDVQAEAMERGGKPHRERGQLLTLLALIAEARGLATEATWDDVAAGLTPDLDVATEKHEFDFAGWLGVAACRLQRGRLTEASAALAQAERWVGDPPRHPSQACDAAQVRSRIALALGDAAAAGAAAERILEVRPTWMGCWRAADCFFELDRHLAADESAGPPSSASRDRAAELYRQVIEAIADDARLNPEDPWFVVPWGFSTLRLAELERLSSRPEAARELLEEALPALERVAALAHRDVWQAEAFEQGQSLLAELSGEAER